jgi:hypothetical protein
LNNVARAKEVGSDFQETNCRLHPKRIARRDRLLRSAVATGKGESGVACVEPRACLLPFDSLRSTFPTVLQCFVNTRIQPHDFGRILPNLLFETIRVSSCGWREASHQRRTAMLADEPELKKSCQSGERRGEQ